MTTETLKINTNYDISTEYPYEITKKSTGKKVKEWLNDNGYYRLCLNFNGVSKKYYKHQLVATQWIENDDPKHKTQIDHINRDKTDNHIENLRFVSSSQNNLNKRSICGEQYEYTDEISDEAIEIDEYHGHVFNHYHYDPKCDSVFFYNVDTKEYRKLIPREGRLNMRDINGENRTVSLNKLKFLNGF